MDSEKIGGLIRTLRRQRDMTQRQLAEKLFISEQAVSKWECGQGCPDVSLLTKLSELFGVPVEQLLNGQLSENDAVGGNMKKSRYFVCPVCGSITATTGEADIACCGRRLEALIAKKADEAQKLSVESIDGDRYVSSGHPMTKAHYISFVAFATGDRVQLYKQYPEWNLQLHIPERSHGMLLWYDTRDGLFYQLV